jgi:hypothetical protein
MKLATRKSPKVWATTVHIVVEADKKWDALHAVQGALTGLVNAGAIKEWSFVSRPPHEGFKDLLETVRIDNARDYPKISIAVHKARAARNKPGP